ncbi:hypothetical protein JX265_007834 [Neoarthrinium moseri]|uniref:Uncharacterized protein n=1 Tax=Neoarthrinium moseri TaxID=1658444 RepID=A0A9P9WJL7_9PEZI|nr:hypothetical protein JX265_007834 [Neoarthrinium moseri]
MGLFGQLYPYPPELAPTTSAMPHTHDANATSTLSNNTDGKARRPVPVGAIVGAIIGVVLLVILVIIATVLIARRKRRQARVNNMKTTTGAGGGDDGILPSMPEAEQRRRLRLSTIPEQASPISPAVSSAGMSRFKSTRRSYGPEWPMGSTDPLESHPVPTDPEKRASPEPIRTGPTVPTLQLPAVPATRVTPAPPPTSPSTILASEEISPSTPHAAPVMLQSPRLSYHPVSPIDAAFSDEVEKRVSRLDGAAPPAPEAHSQPPSRARSLLPEAEEVSPIDEDEHAVDNRLSLISVPSMHDRSPALDEIVSPVSLEEDDSDLAPQAPEESGTVSPVTVSPIESRRSSTKD